MRSDESAKRKSEAASKLNAVGSQLRAAREAAGLSAKQLADSLHMGHEQLDALENGERERLPEPVFIKAMTRRVAARLQIDADPLIDDLTIAMAWEQDKGSDRAGAPLPTPTVPRNEPSETRRGSTPSALIWKTLASIALLAGAGVGSALFFAKHRQMSSPAVAANPLLPEPAQQSPEQATKDKSPQQRTSPSASPALSVTSQEPSWLKVRNAERETVYEGTLDDTKPLALNPGDEILAGRPDLVYLSIGEQAPQPLGDISDVRWRKITPEL